MNGEQKAWSLGATLVSLTLLGCIFIMARCSVDIARVETDAADCAKRGGTWHVADGAGLPSYCEEARK